MTIGTAGRTALFADWTLATLWGATPYFAWPGLRVHARLVLPHAQWPALWRAALGVADGLARTNPALAPWSAALRAADPQAPGFDPLLAGWRALCDALALPAYPASASGAGDDSRTWRFALPYRQIAALALELLRAWLEIAAAATGREQIALQAAGVDKWLAGFDRLRAALPAPTLAGLHHGLWRHGVTWQWLGDDRTRIGEGFRQKVIQGAGDPGLWRDPDRWRIPTYTVTGSIGKTTTTRLLRQLLAGSGARIGAADSDGAWIGEERLARGDSIGGNAAHALLRDPRAEAVVLEQGRAGILRHGVPFARSDVGVLLNVDRVHLGLEGIETIEQLADAKALGIAPAKVSVLNHDNAQCRRIGAAREAGGTVWFSVTAPGEALRVLSESSMGAAGIERDAAGAPRELTIWHGGEPALRVSLEGVAPFHGMLGEKTLEELLGAVCAAWAGPLPVDDWQGALRALRLDNANHAFRASMHRRGNVVFVLDKSGEEASSLALARFVETVATNEGATWRIAVMTRAAAELPEVHRAAARALEGGFDEFACFDRPDTYESAHALACYEPGSIPLLLRDEIARAAAGRGLTKPVSVHADWRTAEQWLDARLAELPGTVLVLINQPATGVAKLNDAILDYVSRPPPAGPGISSG